VDVFTQADREGRASAFADAYAASQLKQVGVAVVLLQLLCGAAGIVSAVGIVWTAGRLGVRLGRAVHSVLLVLVQLSCVVIPQTSNNTLLSSLPAYRQTLRRQPCWQPAMWTCQPQPSRSCLPSLRQSHPPGLACGCCSRWEKGGPAGVAGSPILRVRV
jgi:hypothetical protein